MGILKTVDWFLFAPAVFLMVLGGLVLSSVSKNAFPEHFIFLSAALIVFYITSKIDVDILFSLSGLLYIFSLLLLISTLILGFIHPGVVTRGASRWIYLGPFALQPSEFIKPALLLFFANVVSSRTGFLRFFLALAAFLPAFILVALQPDLGSAIVLSAGFLGILFFGGLPLRALAGAFVLLTAFLPFAWQFLANYQKLRILTFLYPTADPLGAGYNSLQAMIAVGSGGLFGRGLGQGTQSQLSFLPERHTDFIFAALSEELGFAAATLALAAFFIILYRLIIILRKQENVLLQSLLGGIFFVFFIHIAVNVGMNMGVLPITGIPLPFVSSGGSSLLTMSAMLGMAAGISSRLKTGSRTDIILM
ncbi:MAG: FtsW/RodA/SpoVE family cell cycle protein [Candidatus Blackburnbacteria bacterium]|nr:FtsW/RodA/SpoVE family cell cycle protein [Candidatus Blackburnbacteria bacterium]